MAGRAVDLPVELGEACRAAEAAVLRLDSRHGETLAGLGTFLVRTESVASSRIERVYADLDDIARASVAAAASDSARLTVDAARATTTLIEGVDASGRIDEAQVLLAHRALLQDDRLERAFAGRYRDMQNWIGGSDFSPRTAVHVPPPPDEVSDLMRDLVVFANRDDLSPLAQAALAHGQFEAIHPFTDGNGRIGRALIALVLRRRRLASSVVVPIAAAMLADVDRYFETLRGYREGDAGVIVSYLAEATEHAATESAESAARLATLEESWRDRVRPRAGSSAATLIGGLLRHAVLDIRLARLVTGSSETRTYEALDRLVEHDVLREITGGGRNRVWVAVDVMDEVADLDDRIGRRMAPHRRWR